MLLLYNSVTQNLKGIHSTKVNLQIMIVEYN